MHKLGYKNSTILKKSLFEKLSDNIAAFFEIFLLSSEEYLDCFNVTFFSNACEILE